MKKHIVIPLVVVVVAGILLWYALSGRAAQPGVITGNGTIEATEVDVTAEVSGKVLSLAVDEGDEVKEGERIAVLDKGGLAGQVEQAAGNLSAAQAALAELQAGTRREDIRHVRAQYTAAQRALQQAKAQRDLVYSGPRSEVIRQLRAGYAQAQQQLALVKEGPRKEDIAQLQAAYAQAKAQCELVKAGPREEEIAQLRAALAQATAHRDLVKAGPRTEDIEQQRAGLVQAKVTLSDAETELRRTAKLEQQGAIAGQQVDEATTRRDVAKAGVEQAQARLDAALSGARPEELREAEATVEAAQQKLLEAQAGARPQEVQQADALAEMAQQRLAAALAGSRPQEIHAAEQGAEGARERLAEAQHGSRPQEIRLAEAAVAQAQAQVDAARAALDLALAGPRRESLDAAQARVVQAKGTLHTAAVTAGQTTVTAPADGVVILRNVEPGELVTPGLPIIRFAKLKTVWLRVYVPEEQVGAIHRGQHAVITTDAYTGKQYQGRVTEIAEEPEFTPKNVQTKEERVKLVFGIKIEVDNRDGKLKPGMPADAVLK